MNGRNPFEAGTSFQSIFMTILTQNVGRNPFEAGTSFQ